MLLQGKVSETASLPLCLQPLFTKPSARCCATVLACIISQSLPQLHQIGTLSIPISQRRKLRHRATKGLVQVQSAGSSKVDLSVWSYGLHDYTEYSAIKDSPWCISGFYDGSNSKKSACNAGDTGDAGSIPGSGRSPGRGNCNPLQYSCLGNLMDIGASWATVHGITKSQSRLSDLACTHAQKAIYSFHVIPIKLPIIYFPQNQKK